MILINVLEAIGNTPLIRLNRMPGPDDAEILVKFEAVNIGGSVKTRTAYNMILDAEKKGLIGPDTIICEPTSGNQGIGLALVAAVRGYKAVIVMPSSVSEERRKLIQNYGAEVIIVEDETTHDYTLNLLNKFNENNQNDSVIYLDDNSVYP